MPATFLFVQSKQERGSCVEQAYEPGEKGQKKGGGYVGTKRADLLLQEIVDGFLLPHTSNLGALAFSPPVGFQRQPMMPTSLVNVQATSKKRPYTNLKQDRKCSGSIFVI